MSKVTGYRQTAAALRKIANFPKSTLTGVSQKALTPMLKAAKTNLRANRSYRRGVLFRSMRIRKLRSTTAMSEWVIAATGRGVGIAHLVEFGTEPHWQPKRRVMHPGADAKPFLTPAYDATGDLAVKIFADEFGKKLLSYAASVAYKG